MMKRHVKKFIDAYGILGMCILVSAVLHLAVLAGFGSYKLFRYYFPVDGQFEAVPYQKKSVKLRTISHKVSLRRKPPKQAKVIRRISVNKLSRVSLPTVPRKEKLKRKFEVSKSFLEGSDGFGSYDDLGLGDDALFGTIKKLDNAFSGTIYERDKGDNTIGLTRRQPLGRRNSIYTKQLNVPTTQFDKGFPGVTERFEWFTIVYTADFYVRTPGEYTFIGSADDGILVEIDGREILRALCKTAEGKKKLDTGKHRIKVIYHQGPRYAVALKLEVIIPGDTVPRIFNLNDFLPPAGN
jgi:hypothetical protein